MDLLEIPPHGRFLAYSSDDAPRHILPYERSAVRPRFGPRRARGPGRRAEEPKDRMHTPTDLDRPHSDLLRAEAQLTVERAARAPSSTAPTSRASRPMREGVIQIFNVGAERMLGYTAAEVMNKITPADISDPRELVAPRQGAERGARDADHARLRGAGVQGLARDRGHLRADLHPQGWQPVSRRWCP